MKFQTMHDQPSLTVHLDKRDMDVTIRDDGTITVTQGGHPLWRHDEYELTLPDMETVAHTCSERYAEADSDEFPASGTAPLEVTHWH